MSCETHSFISAPAMTARPSWRARLMARPIARLAARLCAGSLTVELPSGERITHRAVVPGPDARVVVRRWRALWRIALGGDLGLAEAYIDGDWGSPDLVALLELGVVNETAFRGALSGFAMLRALGRVRHWLHANTPRGSRRNIAAHYDLGNDFYAHWLDASMSYSSALYAANDQSLDAAQREKLDRAIALLGVLDGDNVLEIGCGWGALAERLIERHNCRVTGLTLSTEQLAYTRARLAARRLAANGDLRLQDYRGVDGRYDRVVSIEMIEAVGERYWPVYFAKLRQCLAAGGTALLQAITIAEDRFAAYRSRPDFIQRYIFPGGMLPTVEAIRGEAAKAGLALVAHQSFGPSYARTLAEWRARFLRAWPEIENLGFDARFRRMWEYYLCYCEAGFRNGVIDVGFFKLAG